MKLIIKIFFIYIALFPKLVYSQTTPSGFQTIFYEGFDYTAGEDLYYQSGGNGFTSNWKKSYLDRYLGIQSSGWTYPNLQTTGLRAAYDSSCYGTCNVISSSGRDVPSQATGVLYLQFLAHFGSESGGGSGTPHLRLYDGTDLKLLIGRNTSSSFWELVDVNTNTTVTTDKTLNALRLIIIRLDYDNGGIKMWIDPTLNAFNYSSPPEPTTEIPNISAPSFNNLQIYLRSNGSPGIDEIHAFKSLTVDNTLPTVSSFVLSDSALKAGETATVTLTFSEAVAGFSNADITVVNGILSTMTTGNNITWTGTFTPSINIEDATNILTLSSNYTDVAGNAGPSATTSNYAIDTSLPTAAITYNSVSPYKNGETLVITTTFNEAMLDSPVSQIVITGSGIANVTATNMTKTSTTVYTYSYVVPTGDGIGTISLSNGTDLAGNAITSTPTSGTTFTVDNTVSTASLAYSVGGTTVSSVSANDVVTITATFNENIADSPVVQISGSGVATISATNMTKVSANSYTYAWTVGTGAGTQTFALATGTDIAGNVVTAAPTSGATIVIDAPQHLTKYGKISIASADLINKYGAVGGTSGLTANGKRISISTAPDGLTSATASTSAYQIIQDFPGSTDGLYWIANSNINSGTPFQIYADMTTDGGGWTLVLNYLHQGGTNPALAVKTNSFPIQASTTLGTDESAATTNWGHLAPATLNAMPFTQLRFYGKTSFHARIIHFKTTHANTIAYFKTGTGNMTGISSSYTALTGHTAYLPASTTNYYTSQGNDAMTNFPFWLAGTYHWGIRGGGSRWEVDDVGGDYNTFHQIWVK